MKTTTKIELDSSTRTGRTVQGGRAFLFFNRLYGNEVTATHTLIFAEPSVLDAFILEAMQLRASFEHHLDKTHGDE